MAFKNSWFKHYNDSSDGLSIRNAWANRDYDVVAYFWLILELISKYENREICAGYISISPLVLCRITHTNERGLKTVLTKVRTYFGDNLIVTWSKLVPNMAETIPPCFAKDSDQFVQFFCRNWLELQENRGGKRTSKSNQKHDRREKREVRRKNIETEAEGFLCSETEKFRSELPFVFQNEIYFSKLKTKLAEVWVQIYPPEWINAELQKAVSWIHANPTKSPKSDFPKFFNNWLSRGWETYRKSLPAERAKSDYSFLSKAGSQ